MRNYLRKPVTVIIILFLLISASCPSEPEPYIYDDINRAGYSPNAQRLLSYLSDQYGNKIISGQMDTAWTTNNEMDMISRVYNDTGKYPALKGFDMMELPQSWTNYGRQQIDEAIEWWDGKNNNEKLLPDKPDIHGIVTFCWHWRTPNQFYYKDRNLSSNTSFRIPWKDGKLDIESDAFKNTIISDLDKAAALLQILKEKDIPVLWRPLHEAAGDSRYPGSGGWFWWGANDVSEPASRYKALWEFMYDYLGNGKGLNNLIWVWNGQNAEWYPNPDTVDIAGYDVYTNASTPQTARNYSSQKARFTETLRMVPNQNRMVALTENGAIPDPDECIKDDAMWLWFCTWNDSQRDNQLDGADNRDNFWAGEYHNTNAHKNHVYNHELIITLDKLPDLTRY